MRPPGDSARGYSLRRISAGRARAADSPGTAATATASIIATATSSTRAVHRQHDDRQDAELIGEQPPGHPAAQDAGGYAEGTARPPVSVQACQPIAARTWLRVKPRERSTAKSRRRTADRREQQVDDGDQGQQAQCHPEQQG